MVSETRLEDQQANRTHFVIDNSVCGDSNSEVDRYLEDILNWSHRHFGPSQLVNAKEEFYWKTGKIFSDDSFFNSRMSYFLDYFLFERPLEIKDEKFRGQTPYIAYTKQVNNDPVISSFIHSVFQVLKCSRDSIYIRDVLKGEKYLVTRREHETFEGIRKKDLFQGFLYLLDNRSILSRGLIFHPSPSFGLIKKFLKKIRKLEEYEDNRALSRLARLQLRHFRHVHVNPRIFYAEEPY